MGSAWATLICYAAMTTACWWWGRKYYPVQYELKRMAGYIGLALALYVVGNYFEENIAAGQAMALTFSAFLVALFLWVAYKMERRAIRQLL
jgi:hypothetical protein